MMQRKPYGVLDEWHKNWAEYRDGFGTIEGSGKYWLGLEKVYRFTQLGSVTLRVEVTEHAT